MLKTSDGYKFAWGCHIIFMNLSHYCLPVYNICLWKEYHIKDESITCEILLQNYLLGTLWGIATPTQRCPRWCCLALDGIHLAALVPRSALHTCSPHPYSLGGKASCLQVFIFGFVIIVYVFNIYIYWQLNNKEHKQTKRSISSNQSIRRVQSVWAISYMWATNNFLVQNISNLNRHATKSHKQHTASIAWCQLIPMITLTQDNLYPRPLIPRITSTQVAMKPRSQDKLNPRQIVPRYAR